MKLLSVLFLLGLFGISSCVQNEKLVVSLYYETLCPDCIGFISEQLYKTWKLIGSSFEIEYVPYGNALVQRIKIYPTTQTSPPKFKCQHGKRECAGNKIHACAIKYLPKESITPFIVCTMRNKDPPSAGPKCSQKLQLDFTPVQNCFDSGEGDTLLFNYGVQTGSLNPPHTYVIWILFNGKFSEDDNEKSQNDFFHVVCSHLANQPSVCNSASVL